MNKVCIPSTASRVSPPSGAQPVVHSLPEVGKPRIPRNLTDGHYYSLFYTIVGRIFFNKVFCIACPGMHPLQQPHRRFNRRTRILTRDDILIYDHIAGKISPRPVIGAQGKEFRFQQKRRGLLQSNQFLFPVW
jgi:hypothetical protein